jgi:branched-chain amino acid transport system substrate-binding protein
MSVTRRGLLGTTLAASVLSAPRLVRAQTSPTIRIGVLTDLSGPYRETAGPGSVAGAKLAAEEAMAAAPGLTVDVIQADHQNKPDVGVTIAREWLDRGEVDAIVDVPNSGVGLAVAQVVREKDKVFLITGAGSVDLTGARCAPTSVHWTFDTYMQARSTGGAVVKQGKDSWFLLVADYAFGHAIQRDLTALVEQSGGRINGAVRYPFPQTSDFSSFLVQAQSSGAKVLGLANAGADTINCIKQAHEFGLTQGGAMTIAAFLMFVGDVHTLGLDAAQGLLLTESFYWDLNDRTRAFTKRIAPKMRADWRPNMEHAGAYGAVLHYLKAAHAMGAAEARKSGTATVDRMKAMPTDDDAFGQNTIRTDGRLLHPAYLFQVKTPAESSGAWDYYKLLATTPSEQAARSLEDGKCPMLAAK